MRREKGPADAAINFRLELLASIVFTIMVDLSVPCDSACKQKLIKMLIIMLCSFGTSTEASAPAVLHCGYFPVKFHLSILDERDMSL